MCYPARCSALTTITTRRVTMAVVDANAFALPIIPDDSPFVHRAMSQLGFLCDFADLTTEQMRPKAPNLKDSCDVEKNYCHSHKKSTRRESTCQKI